MAERTDFKVKAQDMIPSQFRGQNGANALEEVLALGYELHSHYPAVKFTDAGVPFRSPDELKEQVEILLQGYKVGGFGAVILDCQDRNLWQELFSEPNTDNLQRSRVEFPTILQVVPSASEEPSYAIESNTPIGKILTDRFKQRDIKFFEEQGLLEGDPHSDPHYSRTKVIGSTINVPISI